MSELKERIDQIINKQIRTFLASLDDTTVVYEWLWKYERGEVIDFVKNRLSEDEITELVEELAGSSITWKKRWE